MTGLLVPTLAISGLVIGVIGVIIYFNWPYICQAAQWLWEKTKEGANKFVEVVKIAAKKVEEVAKNVFS